jgi:hypothetical protein
VVIDCGTGAHSLGQKLRSGSAKGLRGSILISHTHWDHIQGIPFFEPLFAPDGEWDIYGPKGLRESLREALAAQMQYAYFPVTLDQCPAKIRIRAQAKYGNYCPPVIMIAGPKDQQVGAAAEVADWLVKPFTTAYVRTKISAWLLRMACQSVRERAAGDEQRGFYRTMLSPLLVPDEALSLDKLAAHESRPRDNQRGAALLWMFGREIAEFDTPAFSKKLGEIITQATQSV